MNKLVSILIAILFLSSCDSTTETKNENSESKVEIKKGNIIEEESTTKMLMTTSSNMEPSKDIGLYHCDFTIVLNNAGDTTHWSTNDNNFKTPEGFQIGTNWDEIPPELQNSVNSMPGWGYYIRLDSDWQLGFCEGSSCTDTEPKDESKVKWIFKRND